MRVKKFVAASLAEAMAQAETEFGPDVVVMNSTVRSVRGAGDAREQRFEVTAGAPAAHADRPAARATVAHAPLVDIPVAAADARGRVIPLNLPRPRWRQQPSADAARKTPGLLAADGDSVRLLDLYRSLTEQGMAPDLALELVEATLDAGGADTLSPAEASDALGAALDSRLGPAEPLDRSGRAVVALLGPSGSGKTVTTAKLAAVLGLMEGRRVALISADGSRAGGFAQLEAYAQILDLTVARAHGPEALAAAVEAASDADVVLVDVPGKNPRNLLHMAELKALLDACRPDVAYCCLPATMQPEEALAQLERFLRLGATHLVTTKLDECGYRGAPVAVAAGAGVPWAYWTVGPNVPEDLEVPSGRKLAAGFVRAAAAPRLLSDRAAGEGGGSR